MFFAHGFKSKLNDVLEANERILAVMYYWMPNNPISPALTNQGVSMMPFLNKLLLASVRGLPLRYVCALCFWKLEVSWATAFVLSCFVGNLLCFACFAPFVFSSAAVNYGCIFIIATYLMSLILLTYALEIIDLPDTKESHEKVLTVVIPTYDRDPQKVTKLLHEYLDMKLVKNVVVLEFESGNVLTPISSPGGYNWLSRRYSNDLRFRFDPVMDIDTEFTLITDDDTLVQASYLAALIDSSALEPTVFHGLCGRVFRDEAYSPREPSLVAEWVPVDMLLTSCLVGTTHAMRETYRLFNEKYWNLALPLNGEDIVFCAVNGQCKQWNWGKSSVGDIFISLTPGLDRNTFHTPETKLSNKPNHMHERSVIMRAVLAALISKRD
jgi:hypothetical protein